MFCLINIHVIFYLFINIKTNIIFQSIPIFLFIFYLFIYLLISKPLLLFFQFLLMLYYIIIKKIDFINTPHY